MQPQLGLLKSTMLQLDATFSEKAYGCGSFSDFVERLKHAGYVNLSGSEGRYFIERKGAASPPEAPALRPEEALPPLRDVLETHRLDMETGCLAEQLEAWVQEVHPEFATRRLRLPGVRRTAEFRAGQAAGPRGAGRGEGAAGVSGR